MHRKNIIISFAAGFLIGICAAVLTVNVLNMYQRSLTGSLSVKPPDTEVPLKKTEQPSPVLQQTGSNVDNLTTPKAVATTEVAKTDEKVLAAPQEKVAEISLKKTEQPSPVLQQTGSKVNNLTTPKAVVTGAENHPHPPPAGDSMLPTSVKTDDKALVTPQGKDAVTKSQDEIVLGGINVHIQYARKDKKIIEALSADLKTKGYASVDIENIKHRHRDIRYFHSEDKKAAIILQKQFNNFIVGSTYAKKVNLKIRYLGKVYPKAQKGSLEVWVFF